MIETGKIAAIVAAVHNVWVHRIRHYIAALEARSRFPVAVCDAAAISAVLDTDGRIVLLRAEYVIWEGIVGSDAIYLGGRLIAVGAPVGATIKAYLRTAIICYYHAVAVFGIYPQPVMVAMWC